MTPIDRHALERALVACRAESPARAKQIDSMLTERPWEGVAQFASFAHRVVRWISCRGSRRPVTPTSAP